MFIITMYTEVCSAIWYALCHLRYPHASERQAGARWICKVPQKVLNTPMLKQ